MAAVVYTGGSTDKGQEFTSSRARLLASVDKFIGNKLPSELMSKLDDYYRAQQLGQQPQDTNLPERGYKARNSLITLKNLAQYLPAFTAGERPSSGSAKALTTIPRIRSARTPPSSATRCGMRSTEANRAGVSFYGVDARGLGAGLDEAIDIGGVPADDPTFMSPTSMIQNEVRRAQDSLRVMSEETGGFAIINQNDLNAAFQRIVEDNSSYYVLGYYPSNDKRDGRFRKVEVRVTRPGVTCPGAQRLHGAEGEVCRGRRRTRRCEGAARDRGCARQPHTGSGSRACRCLPRRSVGLDRRRPSRCRSNSRRRP